MSFQGLELKHRGVALFGTSDGSGWLGEERNSENNLEIVESKIKQA